MSTPRENMDKSGSEEKVAEGRILVSPHSPAIAGYTHIVSNLDMFSKILLAIKELGLTTVLVIFICYLLAVQMPNMQRDFKTQTDKLVEAVSNNNRVITELTVEIRALRQHRVAP